MKHAIMEGEGIGEIIYHSVKPKLDDSSLVCKRKCYISNDRNYRATLVTSASHINVSDVFTKVTHIYFPFRSAKKM